MSIVQVNARFYLQGRTYKFKSKVCSQWEWWDEFEDIEAEVYACVSGHEWNEFGVDDVGVRATLIEKERV